MAGTLLKFSDRTQGTYDFACDTVDEIDYLPTMEADGTGIFKDFKKARMGSTCIVGNGNGDLLVYMLFSSGWKQL